MFKKLVNAAKEKFKKVPTQQEVNAFVYAAGMSHVKQHIDEVKAFLVKYPDAYGMPDDKNITALDAAARWGHQNVLDALRDAGMDTVEQLMAMETIGKNQQAINFLRQQIKAQILNSPK